MKSLSKMTVLAIAVVAAFNGCADLAASLDAQEEARQAETDWGPYQRNAAKFMDCAPEEIRTWNRQYGTKGEIYSASCNGKSYRCKMGYCESL